MSRCFVIAEAGVNHNGDGETAMKLVEVAAEAGADAVKFQTFRADKLVQRGAATADYQMRQTGETDQFAMLRRLEMSEELHRGLYEKCSALGIEFMSTPFDEAAADFLIALGMRRIKVPSGELTNLPFLEDLARRDRPLILSTGMSELAEIIVAVNTIREARWNAGLTQSLREVLTILHCTSRYPAAMDDVNLRAMQTIGNATGMPIGYSDHTEGIVIAVGAVAMGAQVIEKHFTLSRRLPGPDHAASLEPAELASMVRAVRNLELALGDGIKRARPAELPVRALVRRSVALRHDLPHHHVLRAEDLICLRPASGIEPRDIAKVRGRRLKRAMCGGQVLTWDDLDVVVP